MTLPPSIKPPTPPCVSDTFCLRLTLAMLYRAGLDAMDELSPYAAEAREFLNSEFAALARQVLQAKSSRDYKFSEASDYWGHFQRVSKQRNLRAQSAEKMGSRD
jgi:hypothetical protein